MKWLTRSKLKQPKANACLVKENMFFRYFIYQKLGITEQLLLWSTFLQSAFLQPFHNLNSACLPLDHHTYWNQDYEWIYYLPKDSKQCAPASWIRQALSQGHMFSRCVHSDTSCHLSCCLGSICRCSSLSYFNFLPTYFIQSQLLVIPFLASCWGSIK